MSDERKGGFTRRDLVRGTLVGAVAASVATKIPAAPDDRIGPGPAPLDLKVNGTVHKISVEPRVTLADALRDRIGLTGTKVVSESRQASIRKRLLAVFDDEGTSPRI